MSWICKFLGDHKPLRSGEHHRVRNGDWDPVYEKMNNHHFERYTTCVRCETEISYARWFNWWGDKARIEDLGREWLEKEDADKVESTVFSRRTE